MTPDFLDDGTVSVEIESRTTGEKRTVQYDPLLLLLTCEELEAKHHLPKDDKGNNIATVAFVTELAKSLHDIGIAGCTPTLAIKLWQLTSDAVSTVKKNMSGTPSLEPATATPAE